MTKLLAPFGVMFICLILAGSTIAGGAWIYGARNIPPEYFAKKYEEGPRLSANLELIPREFDQEFRNETTNENTRFFVFERPVVMYFDGFRDDTTPAVIPRRYVTEFASIPPAFHWYISPQGAHSEAAIVHDWMYSFGQEVGISKNDADAFFYYNLRKSGVRDSQARIMFLAVSLFGSSYGQESERYRFYDSFLQRRVPEVCLTNFLFLDFDAPTTRLLLRDTSFFINDDRLVEAAFGLDTTPECTTWVMQTFDEALPAISGWGNMVDRFDLLDFNAEEPIRTAARSWSASRVLSKRLRREQMKISRSTECIVLSELQSSGQLHAPTVQEVAASCGLQTTSD